MISYDNPSPISIVYKLDTDSYMKILSESMEDSRIDIDPIDPEVQSSILYMNNSHYNMKTPSPRQVFGSHLWYEIENPSDSSYKTKREKRQDTNGPICPSCNQYICCPGPGKTNKSKHRWYSACCLECERTNGASHSQKTFYKHTPYKEK